ncbi:helix-turn-helix domain-containing protein [Streptomyces sp. 184]|uniref:helix-turn-helix domain-containing protein n=1 Tax=Streptomyces sp. 184 TaxID=1827526 RepID=UPI0038913100
MREKVTGSTVPRRQLGRYLRDLRNQARLTVRAAAREMEWSEAKMWRIETGQGPMRSLDVQAMCLVYGAPQEMTEALMGLAKETKARGWWHAYGDVIPEGFDVYVGLEDAAWKASAYGSDVLPGLLQTAGYASAITRTHLPDISEDDFDGRVRLRIDRQALLTRATRPLEFDVVLSEVVLRRPVGGREVMAEQLAHLVYVAERPNVTIRVVPFAAGMHPGVLTGAFVLLRFPLNGDGSESEPPTVYADGYTGGLYLDKSHEIEQYDRAFRGIWEVAHDEQASKRLLAEVAGSYEKG